MSRKGRTFELAYKWLYDLDKEKYKVESPAFVYDKVTKDNREVDVLISYLDSNNELRRIGVECRDRKANEDAMWIEQLITKRNDLELDYIIATTTKRFTKGAIEKAKYHGVIIEEAELLDRNVIDNISDDLFVDFLFFRFEVQELKFICNNNCIYNMKDLLKNVNIIQNMELHNFLNKDYYYSIDPSKIMDEFSFSMDDFYEYSENSFIETGFHVVFNQDSPKIIKDLNIMQMFIKVKLIPFKSSLPLNKSLSTFDVDPKKNKKYSAFYGNEEDSLRITSLDGRNIKNELRLKQRDYYRFVNANLHLNTCFPDGIDSNDINMQEIIDKAMGKFDLTKIL